MPYVVVVKDTYYLTKLYNPFGQLYAACVRWRTPHTAAAAANTKWRLGERLKLPAERVTDFPPIEGLVLEAEDTRDKD